MNWRDEYENQSRSQDYDWLKDLNQVTKFHQRNVGHDHLFLVDKELKLKHKVDLNANITGFKFTDVREKREERAGVMGVRSKLEKLGAAIATSKPKLAKSELTRGRGRRIGREDVQDKAPVGGISRMVSSHLGTSHRLHKGERDAGGSGGSGKTSSTDELWNPYDDNEDDKADVDICRHFQEKAL